MGGDPGDRARDPFESHALGMSTWSNGPGDAYAAHRHDFDKLLVIQKGSIEFELPEEGLRELLEAGDRLHVPAGTLHAAVVGPRGVTCLETHLPRGTLGSEIKHVEGWSPERETGLSGTA